MRCEKDDEVDATFCPFMDAEIKGSTEDIGPEDSKNSEKQLSKKQALTIMEEANENTKELLRLFSEQNEKKENLMKEQNEKQETFMKKRLRANAVDQYARLAETTSGPNCPPDTKRILEKQMAALVKEYNLEELE